MDTLAKVLFSFTLIISVYSLVIFHQSANELNAQYDYVKYLENELDNMNEGYIDDVVSGSDEYQEYYKYN